MEEEKTTLESVKKRASAMFDDAKSATSNAYGKGREFVGETIERIKGTGKAVDEKSDGFFGNNKGLLLGGIAALFAVFGMEGGSFLQPLIVVGSLLLGAFMDKGNSESISGRVYNGLFGKKEETQQSTELSLKKQTDQPSPPPLASQSPSRTTTERAAVSPADNKVHIETNGGHIYVDENGNKRTPPLTAIPNLMHIKVDGNGIATAVSVADAQGKSTHTKDGKEQMVSIVGSDIKFDISVDKSGAKHINLATDESRKNLTELRKIGTELLNKNRDRSSLETEYSSLGNLSAPTQLSASVKSDKKTFIG